MNNNFVDLRSWLSKGIRESKVLEGFSLEIDQNWFLKIK